MKRKTRLALERLEDREVPATFGVPWPDAMHLTASFVPDGTIIGTQRTDLFHNLNDQKPNGNWQQIVLKAIQTWAANANINVGLVADGGQPIGAPGAIQGDTRFGDIRIGSFALNQDVSAFAAPYDPLAGTRSGDIFFNNTTDFRLSNADHFSLFTVALHEAGHALGVPDSSDPNSVMFPQYHGKVSKLTDGDVAAIQALYGPRNPDAYEGANGNDSFTKATPVDLLNVQGDITAASDVDTYKFTMPAWTSGDVTVTVQAAGLSLLEPKLTIFDAVRHQVAGAASTDPLNNTVTIHLGNALPGTTYYFKVDGATNGVFGVGTYRLKTNVGPGSAAVIQALDAVYSGNVTRGLVTDAHTNDTLAKATALVYKADPRFDYTINAAISDATDVDFYRLTVPGTAGGSPVALIASVAALNDSGLDPVVTVYNAAGQPVAADVLANDGGTFVVQVAQAAPGATYVLRVSADPHAAAGHTVGNYVLGASFRATPDPLPKLAQNTLSSTTSGEQSDALVMQVGETQVTQLVLSVRAEGATVPVAVRLRVYDELGNAVLTLDALAGQTTSAAVLLKKGNYTIRFVAATQDNSPLPATTYRLRAKALTDPIDGPGAPPTPPSTDPTPVVIGPPPTPPPPDPTQNPWTPPPPTQPPPSP